MNAVDVPRRPSVPFVEPLEGRRLLAAYVLTDLTPGANVVATAYGVNNQGAVALSYNGHAAVWSAGKLTDLGFSGAALDVNDSGAVCGYDDALGYDRPFVYRSGVKTLLSLSDATHGVARAINAAGTVAGTFNDGDQGAAFGFYAPLGGDVVGVPAPMGTTTIDFTGINDKGQIVGNSDNPGPSGPRAFIYSVGEFKDLGFYSTQVTYPRTIVRHGLSNNGTVALGGTSDTLSGNLIDYEEHLFTVGSNGYGVPSDKGTLPGAVTIDVADANANGTAVGLADFAMPFVYDGTFKTLASQIDPAAGWTLGTATAVNDVGQIVGGGLHGTAAHAYLLTPAALATYAISGTVWNDTDGDGVFDAGESPSGVRTVYVDANDNGKLDAGETRTTSDANGSYTLWGLAAGTYHVSRVLPGGYRLSNGTNGGPSLSVTVNGADVTNANLGSAAVVAAKASISGVVWNDSDKDGIFDANESPSGVRTVFIDFNSNGKLDAGEVSTQSNAAGQYTLSGLAARAYKVTRVFPKGYTLSNAAAGYLTITVGAGQARSGVNLGSKPV